MNLTTKTAKNGEVASIQLKQPSLNRLMFMGTYSDKRELHGRREGVVQSHVLEFIGRADIRKFYGLPQLSVFSSCD